MNRSGINKFLPFAAILFSGLCWYLAFGFTGKYWVLLWIAPVPVFYLSLQVRAGTAFIFSFIAYFIGRLSWLPFLISVARLPAALIFTILLSLIFALFILLSRKTILLSAKWWAVFVFPASWTAFEFLVMRFSPDGSAGSIAYSQSDFLPLVQTASVTGIAGITFLVTLVPSVLTLVAWYRKKKNLQWKAVLRCLILPVIVILFGFIRMQNSPDKKLLIVGAIVLSEKYHHITDTAHLSEETETAELYALEIKKLALSGAKIIVLPERALNLSTQTDSAVLTILENSAKANKVRIVTGYTNFLSKPDHNSALGIDESGHREFNYHKVNLVTGLESQFTRGKEPGFFNYENAPAGIAICKDMDFPAYIQQYGMKEVKFLCIPAWDFRVDGWLHARMAVLRGVENGFGEIRSAREGRLTVSDAYGRILAESSSEKGNPASVTGELPLERISTIYHQTGDWFGWITFAVLFLFSGYAIFGSRISGNR